MVAGAAVAGGRPDNPVVETHHRNLNLPGHPMADRHGSRPPAQRIG